MDANPLVVGGRVYAGSGIGDTYKETCVFCVDAATGKELWRHADGPAGVGRIGPGRRPALRRLGNGNFMESDDKPAGAVLCLDADTGEQQMAL